jgi:hypothetical protein
MEPQADKHKLRRTAPLMYGDEHLQVSGILSPEVKQTGREVEQ